MSLRHGPNVKKLIIRKMSIDAIPNGGGFAAGLEFLSSADNIRNGFKDAEKWVLAAIDAVRAAPDGHTYGDDEQIAAEILKGIEERMQKRK